MVAFSAEGSEFYAADSLNSLVSVEFCDISARPGEYVKSGLTSAFLCCSVAESAGELRSTALKCYLKPELPPSNRDFDISTAN